jgi:hypothetical protein
LHNKQQCWVKLLYKLMENWNILKGSSVITNEKSWKFWEVQSLILFQWYVSRMEPFLTWLSVLSTFFFLNSVSWFWDHWTSRFQACFTGWHCKCSCQSLCSRPWEGSFALTIFSLCCFFPPLFFVLAILRIIETWKHFAKVKEPVT